MTDTPYFDALLASLTRGEAVDWPIGANWIVENQFVERAIHHGVAPLVARRLAERPGHGWPASVTKRLWRIEAEAVGHSVLRERELPRVFDRLAAIDIHPVIIKGAALAYSHFPAPHLRPSSDVDLFIEFEQLEQVCTALQGLGYRRSHLVAGDLIMPQVSYVRPDGHGTQQICDVHWKLARPHAFAQTVTYEELARDAAPLPAFGPHARGASDVHALLIACVHRVAHHVDEARLIWLYDIHLLVERLDAANEMRFVALAAAKGVSGVCASGLAEAQRWFHTAVPPGVIEQLEQQSAEAQEESREFIGHQTNISVLLSDLRLVAGWHEKLRLLQQHVFPSPAYMFRTYGTSLRSMLPALYTRRLFAGAWRWVMQLRSQS